MKIGQATENDLAEIATWRYEPPYDFKVVSPVFAPPDGAQAGFNGDYSGLTINKAEGAHPIWSDTCNADPSTGDRAKSHSSCHRKRGSVSRFRLSKGGGGCKAWRRSGRLRGTTAAHAYLGARGVPRRLSSRGGE